MTVPKVSRRSFATALSGFAAMLGMRPVLSPAKSVEFPEIKEATPYKAQVVELLSREELEQELTDIYNGWMRMPAHHRSTEFLNQRTSNILFPQWALRNGDKQIRDSALPSRIKGHLVGTLCSCGFMSHILNFSEIKPAPKTPPNAFYYNKDGLAVAVTGEPLPGVMMIGPAAPFTFHDRKILPAQLKPVNDRTPSWTIGYCPVHEGSPTQRFAIGMALSFESMCAAVQAQSLDLVGEINFEIMQFQQTLQLSLWAPALWKPTPLSPEEQRAPWGAGWYTTEPVTLTCGNGKMPPQGMVE